MTIPHRQQDPPDGEQWPPAIDDERWVHGAPEFPEGPQPAHHPVASSQVGNAARRNGGAPVSGTAEWGGIEDAAGLLYFRIAAWHDFGYATPPEPHCKPIPPLGERSAEAIKAGHGAIEVIDEIIRDLHVLRGQLIIEMRTDEDVRAVRVDATLAEARAKRETEQADRVPRDEGTARLADSPGFRQLLAHLDEAEAPEARV